MTRKQFDSVWDALYNTPEEVESMKYRSAIQFRFFRDLCNDERLVILDELSEIPILFNRDDCSSHGVQRMIFEFVVNGGKLDKLAQMMEKIISERSNVE